MAAKTSDPLPYFAASGVSALLTFPFWKAAAIGQSGYQFDAKTALGRYFQAARPPWKGSLVVVSGMTWARACIFFGSDEGSRWLRLQGFSSSVASVVPPLLISVKVQIANQPFVRSTIMLQGDPQVSSLAKKPWPTLQVLRHLWREKGASSWWHGTTVGIFRTVPKYVAAILAKDFMDQVLPPADAESAASAAIRSVKKSLAASVVGAVFTNPLDVVQNEMFKTDGRAWDVVRRLCKEEGWSWMVRGCERNVVASAVPIAVTMFLTETFLSWRQQ